VCDWKYRYTLCMVTGWNGPYRLEVSIHTVHGHQLEWSIQTGSIDTRCAWSPAGMVHTDSKYRYTLCMVTSWNGPYRLEVSIHTVHGHQLCELISQLLCVNKLVHSACCESPTVVLKVTKLCRNMWPGPHTLYTIQCTLVVFGLSNSLFPSIFSCDIILTHLVLTNGLCYL
jgi:hypothetical protein